MAKIALNLTSEGLKCPPEVRVELKTCSTIRGTPVQAILDQKKLTRVAGGSKKVKIWLRMGHAYIYFWLWSLLEAPKWIKDPRNGPPCPPTPHPKLPLIDLSPFYFKLPFPKCWWKKVHSTIFLLHIYARQGTQTHHNLIICICSKCWQKKVL